MDPNTNPQPPSAGGIPVPAEAPPGPREPDRPAPPVFTPLWANQLSAAASRPWLWQGYLAPGNVTLLTSQWKSGKTTLIAVLLARLKTGGSLAGLSVVPARAAVITEED